MNSMTKADVTALMDVAAGIVAAQDGGPKAAAPGGAEGAGEGADAEEDPV